MYRHSLLLLLVFITQVLQQHELKTVKADNRKKVKS